MSAIPTSISDLLAASNANLKAAHSAASSGTGGTSSGTSATSKLGRDDFMKLLLTEMTNQDPLRPKDDTAFIAELAQFNSLEQLQQLNTQLGDLLTAYRLSAACALLGASVEGTDSAGKSVSGSVTSVALNGGKPQLTLDGGSTLALASVTKVTPVAAAENG